MERTLAAFSAVILLIGCFTGCGSGEKSSDHRLPAVLFIYSLYGQGSAERRFCDSEGNYYLVLKEELCYLSFAELADKYSSGDIDSDIKLLRICNKDELEKMYQKLLRASAAKDKGLEKPGELPAVDAPYKRWSGICYDDKGELTEVLLHENRCMTDLNSYNRDINDIYGWLGENLHMKG